MTAFFAAPQVQSEPGTANAEDGFVILDGPGGIAVTMTGQAAAATGRSLLAAAEIAAAYKPDTTANPPDIPNDPG